ncbi:hypothetical protein WICMUC_003082 [Wickerhamomyces mucosus]|uniref:asparaginase n=1 Tax=Wickerhamomyces mucosus TaxID=1378264 RepID=A0A9P8PMQ6_9ASCO|nr:hypothetical protein WICMUC_003082 [Wickerhamomyces mucosus]
MSEIEITHPSHTETTIKILGTGGTIASKAESNVSTSNYKVDLTVEDLVKAIPDLPTNLNLKYKQLFNLDSKELTSSHLLFLHKEIVESYQIEGIKNFVITHGTDSLEETAFFLELTINFPDITIVLTGSMRPSSNVSSDAIFNLYQAIKVASAPESKNRGVLVVLNDSIGSGFYITKTNANSLDTFKSSGQAGFLGNFVHNQVHYYYPVSKPTSIHFNIDSNKLTKLLDLNNVGKKRRNELPEVSVFYNVQGFNPTLIQLAIDQIGTKAIVIATSGAGSLSEETNEILKFVWEKYAIPVIFSKRSQDGCVTSWALPKFDNDKTFKGAIAGGYLNPQKCRILIQLCLLQNYSIDQIKSVFESDGIFGG